MKTKKKKLIRSKFSKGDLFRASFWAFVIASGLTRVFLLFISDIYLVRFFLFLFFAALYFYVQEDSHKAKVKNKKIQDKYDHELSTYIDMMARVNALIIEFENTEDVTKAYFSRGALETRLYQQTLSWYRQNGGLEGKSLDFDKLHFGNKIEKAFEHCDQWNWSERKEEHIG